MNKSDSERIGTVLENVGYKSASEINEADLIVVNMCSVRQSAVDRIYGRIKNFAKLRAQNPRLKTILTGCILKSDLKKFENHFDYILSIKTLPFWQNLLKKEKFFYYPGPRSPEFCQKFDGDYLKIKPNYSNFSAFILISTGCNNFCSFCVVPYVRGPEICRPASEILDEVKNLIKRGSKEIWLLGQNVNSYKSEQRTINNERNIDFVRLLKMINEIPGDFWIRFTSSHPKDFSNSLVETIAKCKKVTPYINLPVQSGDNAILRKMKRPYTIEKYKKLVKKIRDSFDKNREALEKEVAISTDVIVGFPGETKKQFENTVKLFKEMKFDMAYIAEYSPRPQTTAFKLKDDVSKEEKEERRKTLTEILKETALENNKKYVGKTVDVLTEENKNEFLFGKTRAYKTVRFKGPKTLIGKFVKVKIISALPWGLKGEIL